MAETGQKTLTIQEALDLAVQHHSAGRLPEAEGIYQQILEANPNQPVALRLLGTLAHQVGKNDLAVDLISKALAVDPGDAEAHNNLGITLYELGRLDEAVASHRQALAIRTDYAEAHSNLGNALQGLGKLDDAIASYQKALAIKPDFADAHRNLGGAFKELGKLEEAVTSFHKALAIKPTSAEAHCNLGSVLRKLGKLDAAVASFNQAIAIKPDYAEAHNNLGHALRFLGNLNEALKCHRQAIALNPQNNSFWLGLAVCLETFSFTSGDDKLFQDLLRLLEQPFVYPAKVVRPIVGALQYHPKFSQIIDPVSAGGSETGFSFGNAAEQLSLIPLFLRILGLSPIIDLKIERALTFMRHAMLRVAIAGQANERGLPFSAALALQCFTNEYVYWETDEETESVEILERKIAALVEAKRDIPPALIAALAAYRSLYQFPWARELLNIEWEGGIKEVVERQILEPLEERSIRPQIPCLTPITDAVSRSVREQYEENPYPRWIRAGGSDISRPIGAVLQGAPLHLELGDYQSPENPEILIAGCGTGQHSLSTSSHFSSARVLAVDLSLSSLSYALRKTNELGVSNVEYAQGDIMELGNLDRQFDLIDCSGVLHHLGDPLAGWRVLVDLLRPGGLMKIGLYSETARQSIVEARALISEKGYTASPEDIRQCRSDMIKSIENGDRRMAAICNSRDFFSLSSCRDLLFHVQEHRFTLPQIEAALTALQLEFLGFEIQDQSALRKFRAAFPMPHAQTSLSQWHQFELQNPDTFFGMYQFWCRKI